MAQWDSFTTEDLVQLEVGDVRSQIVQELSLEIDRRIYDGYHTMRKGLAAETLAWEGTD